MDGAGRRLACKTASYGLNNGFIVFHFLANETTRTDARFRVEMDTLQPVREHSDKRIKCLLSSDVWGYTLSNVVI